MLLKMQRLTPKIVFLLFLFLGILLNSKAEKVVYSFAQNWLRYDNYYEAYLPLKNSELENCKNIHQTIQVEKYRNYNLSFTATKGLSLFVNNKLVYKKIGGEEEIVRLSVNTLESNESGEAILTFYHSEGVLPLYTASITNNFVVPNEVQKESQNRIVFRNLDRNFGSCFILFLLIASLFIVFKQMYPKEYLRYYSFRAQENIDHLLPGTFSISSLLMALINGLTISLLVYTLKLDEVIFNSSSSLLNGTLYILLFYTVFYFGKYFYLSGIAWLFNYSKLVAFQFSEYTRLLEIICLIAAALLFAIEASGFIKLSIKPVTLYYSLIIVLIFCVIKVIFLFFRLITHRNLYLFSYICAAEILPLIITIKILLF